MRQSFINPYKRNNILAKQALLHGCKIFFQEAPTMDAQKVDMFIIANQKNLPADKIVYLREKMLAADEGKFALLITVDIKDSTTLLLISIFLGYLGIDRFMLGDTGMGILKLLTCGVCGILTIIDWFTVQKRTRELNYNNIMAIL